MGHTYSSLHYHIVFSTKERMKFISTEIKDSLFAYLAKTINNEYGFARKVNGMDDHIHICADFKPKFAVSDILRKIKSNSSAWVNKNFQLDYTFAWQEGYGSFTISKSSISNVINYIETQNNHHKNMSFKEEFIFLLKKHEVDYDEKYTWK